MTKQDYELIATAIKSVSTTCDHAYSVVIAIADAMATDNPRFNRDRFIKAATIE